MGLIKTIITQIYCVTLFIFMSRFPPLSPLPLVFLSQIALLQFPCYTPYTPLLHSVCDRNVVLVFSDSGVTSLK